MQNKKRILIGAAGALLVLALTGGGMKAWAEKNAGEDTKIALSADQMIASIRTAVAAKPGQVLEVEAESEGGKAHCDVEILAADGKTYEVEVDVASNTAGEIEVEDGSDDKDED